MTSFVDASAIVKHYVTEEWSATVENLGERIVSIRWFASYVNCA